MVYFHSLKNPGLKIDLVGDIREINNSAVWAESTGMIILGGGVVKHHICNANLMVYLPHLFDIIEKWGRLLGIHKYWPRV